MSTRSSHSTAPLRVELRGSRILCASLCVLAGGGLSAIAASALPLLLQFGAAIAVLTHLAVLLRDQYRLRGALSWRDGAWSWVYANANANADGEHPLQLYGVTVWPALIVLRMRDGASGRRRVFALMVDSTDADALRRLRICLRHMAIFETDTRGI